MLNTRFLRKLKDKVLLSLINADINRNKSIVDSTWGIIKDFFKMSQNTKYTSMVEEIKKDKQPFEQLLSKIKDFSVLIDD